MLQPSPVDAMLLVRREPASLSGLPLAGALRVGFNRTADHGGPGLPTAGGSAQPRDGRFSPVLEQGLGMDVFVFAGLLVRIGIPFWREYKRRKTPHLASALRNTTCLACSIVTNPPSVWRLCALGLRRQSSPYALNPFSRRCAPPLEHTSCHGPTAVLAFETRH